MGSTWFYVSLIRYFEDSRWVRFSMNGKSRSQCLVLLLTKTKSLRLICLEWDVIGPNRLNSLLLYKMHLLLRLSWDSGQISLFFFSFDFEPSYCLLAFSRFFHILIFGRYGSKRYFTQLLKVVRDKHSYFPAFILTDHLLSQFRNFADINSWDCLV